MNGSSYALRNSALYYLFTFIALIATLGLVAQNGDELIRKMSEEDRESLKALVMYPEETREAIFIAAQQPAALIKINKVQNATSESFNNVISLKDKDTQKALWDLTRYPGLIDDMVEVGPNNESRAVKALQSHPEIIRVRAIQMYNQQFAALGKIASLKKDSEVAFSKMMDKYDPATAKALSKLLEHPEVLGIMTESMDVTVTVGDMYRQDPEGTMVLAEELNTEVADENARELNDWRERLENDPEAMEEFKESTEEFLQEHEEDDVYYTEQEKDSNTEVVEDGQVREVHHYYNYSYPYWFGYPRWYYSPRWRPYPWRYDWGWSFGVSWGGWNVWGMPSFYYMNWYYGYPYHYYNHPSLACHFSAHYYGHRNSMSSVSSATERWHKENASVLPSRLNPTDAVSIEAVKELGKLETARGVHNRNNPDNPSSKTEFLASQRDKYPTLAVASREGGQTSAKGEVQAPETRPDMSKKPDVKDPARIDKPQAKPNKQVDRSKSPSRSDMDKAKELHRSGWEKQKRPSKGSSGASPTKSKSSSGMKPSKSRGSVGSSPSRGSSSPSKKSTSKSKGAKSR